MTESLPVDAIQPREDSRRTAIVAIALFLFAVAVYARSFSAEFVYDARAQILTDTFIHQPRHFVDVLSLRVMHEDVLDNNRPVHLLVLMIDSLLWGKKPFGYHLTSILLHGGCTALIFLLAMDLLRRSGAKELRAMAGAAAGAAI